MADHEPASGTTFASRTKSLNLLEQAGITDVTQAQLQTGGKALEQRIETQALFPQQDFALPTPRPLTQTTGALGVLESGTDSFTKQLEAQAAAVQEPTQQSFQNLIRSLNETQGETRLSLEAEQQLGVPGLEAELKDINNQLIAEQVALRRQIEQIEKNVEGKFGGAVEANVRRAQTESLRRQADLAVVQMAAQGKFDSAKAIADRAVKAQMEEQRQRNEILAFVFETNKEFFNKAEERAFASGLADRNRALDAEEKKLQQISDLKLNMLTNGAPRELILQDFDSVDELLASGGQYVDALL